MQGPSQQLKTDDSDCSYENKSSRMGSKNKDDTCDDDTAWKKNVKQYLLFTLHLLKIFQGSLCLAFLI